MITVNNNMYKDLEHNYINQYIHTNLTMSDANNEQAQNSLQQALIRALNEQEENLYIDRVAEMVANERARITNAESVANVSVSQSSDEDLIAVISEFMVINDQALNASPQIAVAPPSINVQLVTPVPNIMPQPPQQVSIDQQLTRVALHGSYFRPAGLHYSDRTPHLHNVICDRCGLHGLIACVGLEQDDLCMHCTQFLLDQYEVTNAERIAIREHSRIFENLPHAKFQEQYSGFLSTGRDA